MLLKVVGIKLELDLLSELKLFLFLASEKLDGVLLLLLATELLVLVLVQLFGANSLVTVNQTA